MIAFLIYLLLFLGLIYYTGFFKVLGDPVVSKKQFTALFFAKTLSIPVFYLVYQKIYGGLEKFDSGKFYHDAQVLNAIAFKDPGTYLKILFGLQNESGTSYDFKLLKDTLNWDNGIGHDILYNDNRVVIRIHSVLHFLAFNSYFVHALFSCLLSFIGIVCIYKSLKHLFKGKELSVLLILCFFPALWFYTGALLKEGLTLFIMGLLLYYSKQVVSGISVLKNIFILLPFFFLAILLKPYVLVPAFILFGCFFILERQQKRQFMGFSLLLLFFFILFNTVTLLVRHESLYKMALQRQLTFANASKGGLLLTDNILSVRLPFDTTLIKAVKERAGYYTLKKNVRCHSWTNGKENERYLIFFNQDTLRQYQLLEKIAPSRSDIDLTDYGDRPLFLIGVSFYYSLFYPLFFNTSSALLYLASFENLLILLALIIVLRGLALKKKSGFLPFVLLCFSLSICLLVGITTPNSGAIFRYRSPAIVFLLLAALYYLEPLKIKLLNRFH